MDFSFWRNWFNFSASGESQESDGQSNPTLSEGFEIIEDYEFINPRDPNEIHSLPSSYQIDKSIVEIAGFNKEKLLEMSNFCKISYGDADFKLSEKKYKAVADKLTEEKEDFIILENEKMHKTRAEFMSEGYEVIPFGNSFEEDAGCVFIKGQNNNSLPWYSSKAWFVGVK
ncbi:hypothetical protein [Wolbachia endosymbiont of Ctenocephalides felis wCfeT]|uniref:hypothetical protein n=1 Tax=Wolbachia endosymbiont of Ctenocephalides felis wCfeT TaxID=2732593 RepID=UPI001FE468BB|nr:hypothetical protein [Wolbachia endosymbiont of Ctenocephalides felis wCfeT]